MAGRIVIEEAWEELAAEIRNAGCPRTVYVVGASDRGKTTFCGFLTESLSASGPTAYIDCDPGQSLIGPPTTLGMRYLSHPTKPGTLPVLSFTGSITPTGHLLQNLCAIKKLFEKALGDGCKNIVLDSSGFVLGSVAPEFQFNVIDLLAPRFIVGFQQGQEIEPILANFAGRATMKVARMPVSPAASARDQARRQEFRAGKWKDYFQGAGTHELDIADKGLHGNILLPLQEYRIRDLLVGLCDEENYLLSLGVVRGYDAEAWRLTLFAPRFDRPLVKTVQFGSVRLDTSDFTTSY